MQWLPCQEHLHPFRPPEGGHHREEHPPRRLQGGGDRGAAVGDLCRQQGRGLGLRAAAPRPPRTSFRLLRPHGQGAAERRGRGAGGYRLLPRAEVFQQGGGERD